LKSEFELLTTTIDYESTDHSTTVTHHGLLDGCHGWSILLPRSILS
jgi:hypothetical protein